MYTVKELLDICYKLAPKELAESYDNVGLMVGGDEEQRQNTSEITNFTV